MNGRKSFLISLQFLAFFDPLKVNSRAVKVPRNYLFPILYIDTIYRYRYDSFKTEAVLTK